MFYAPPAGVSAVVPATGAINMSQQLLPHSININYVPGTPWYDGGTSSSTAAVSAWCIFFLFLFVRFCVGLVFEVLELRQVKYCIL